MEETALRCPVCFSPLDGPGRGSGKIYCSNACRQKHHRGKRNAPQDTSFDLIYCAGNNLVLDAIADRHGFLLGIRSGSRKFPGRPVTFVDIDYKKPRFERHLEVVKKLRPRYAVIPDLSDQIVDETDVERALGQYALLKEFCEVPLIVPKIAGQIALLPSSVAIGYSIPTSYGGAAFPLWELEGRRVHLLGGSPKQQMALFQSLSVIAQVKSADGNYAMKMATDYAMYWQGDWIAHPGRKLGEKDLYVECWERSCRNLRRAWDRVVGGKGELFRYG